MFPNSGTRSAIGGYLCLFFSLELLMVLCVFLNVLYTFVLVIYWEWSYWVKEYAGVLPFVDIGKMLNNFVS